MMRPGAMRHQVTVEALSSASTALGTRGQETQAWGTHARGRACFEYLRGSEAQVARQQFATATHKVTMRHYDGYSVKHRLRWNGRTFHIHRIENAGENDRWLVLTVSEKV